LPRQAGSRRQDQCHGIGGLCLSPRRHLSADGPRGDGGPSSDDQPLVGAVAGRGGRPPLRRPRSRM